uniref:Uncharacterized protein n=1 Tax=Arundo donax TaxID=35708 RepID=A0A0A9HGZ8_ARUDO
MIFWQDQFTGHTSNGTSSSSNKTTTSNVN